MTGGDIGLFVQADSAIDLVVQANDLLVDGGLSTSVILSLFTDRQVDLDEIPFGETSRRGWWGDLFTDLPGDLIGSRLWLLKREKRTVETLSRAEEYALEALQWMLDDGVADLIEPTASYDLNGALQLQILITKPKETLNFRFKTKWGVVAEET